MTLHRAGRGPTLARGALLGLALWLAPAGTPAEAVGATTVTIENFSFVPDAITIKAGTTVTWVNGDDIPHSVVLADRSFRSKPLDTHDKAMFTFTQAGEVTYFCGLHPHMRGTIIVQP